MGHWEPLGRGGKIYVTREHGFTTDTLLLADFSAPSPKEYCADFGTGCGTIALLWALRQRPRKIVGVELQVSAFGQAQRSAQANALPGLSFVHANIMAYKTLFPKGNLDRIACNPPYKAQGSGLQNVEPAKSLARHEAALSLDELAEAAAFSLKFGGKLCICQRPERLTDAMVSFRAKGLEPKRLRLVQQRPDKPPSLFLLECRRGGKPGLTILPTLMIEKEGDFSPEMQRIYGDYLEGRR